MDKRIIILAYECAPYHRYNSTIGAQRPYQFAKHLPKFGWKVIVLCCDFSRRYSLNPNEDWQALICQEVSAALNKWEGDRSLTIPLPSLQYADPIDRIWLRTVHMDDSKGTFAPRPGLGMTFLRKAATLLKLFRGDHSQSWQAVATYALGVLIQKGYVPDIQVAEHGPDASLHIAYKANKKWSIPYIVGFRDPILQPIPTQLRPLYHSYLKNILLKPSSAIINVNPAWVEMDKKDFNKPTYLVTNGYDEDEFQGNIEQPDQFTIAYLGNISFPSKLELFFEGLKRFVETEKPKRFVFQYRGNAFVQIKNIADSYGLLKWVDVQAAIPRAEAINLMRAAHLLLLFSIDSKQEKDVYLQQGYYPGKVFEYFATQNPILMVPGDKGVLDDLLLSYGYQSIAKSSEKVQEILSYYYHNWLRRVHPTISLRSTVNFTRQSQTARLNEILTENLCAE